MLSPNNFYSPGAYCLEHIPDQQPATKQPWLRQFSSMRLPWGDTQDMLPPCVPTNIKPAQLRHQEEFDRVRSEQKSRGVWEFNRRTGLLTVFDYDNNGEYKKNGTKGSAIHRFLRSYGCGSGSSACPAGPR